MTGAAATPVALMMLVPPVSVHGPYRPDFPRALIGADFGLPDKEAVKVGWIEADLDKLDALPPALGDMLRRGLREGFIGRLEIMGVRETPLGLGPVFPLEPADHADNS